MTVESHSAVQTQDVPHILVVDDEFTNRLILSRVFASCARITEVENGQQALALLEEDTFTIVLLDIMMPGLNGLEVLSAIRQSPKTADLPVILISALSDNGDMVNGLSYGANDYIGKPFDIDVVRARVATQIALKQAMDTQKQAIAQMQAAQKMKDRLFNIASHDLKAPLHNLGMVGTLLQMYVGEDPSALEILDIMQASIDNMNTIIEEFLDMAICQSGGIEILLRPVDVQPLLLSVAESYSVTAAKKDIALHVGDMPGSAYADSQRLTQILNNLVSNALKYSPSSTTVSIWSETVEDRIRISVADQGPGIPANERDRLFTEFGKLSTQPTGNESSTGLGLWIVKYMVDLQKGEVGVECPLDGGSIFWVELPAA